MWAEKDSQLLVITGPKHIYILGLSLRRGIVLKVQVEAYFLDVVNLLSRLLLTDGTQASSYANGRRKDDVCGVVLASDDEIEGVDSLPTDVFLGLDDAG